MVLIVHVALHPLMLQGIEVNTKSRGDAVGFALVGLEPMSVGKRVFLLAIVTIPTVMRCMTTASPTVQKAAYGRKKSPAVAGKKNSCLWWVTAPTRSGLFYCPGLGREVCSIYIIRWSGAVGGIAVVLVLFSLMLPGDDNDMSRPLWMVRTPGNSVGVAISKPRVEVRSASTLGIDAKKESNSVGVAFSRRRYLQQDNCK